LPIANFIGQYERPCIDPHQTSTPFEDNRNDIFLMNEYEFAFANGGDQNNDTIPERPICEELGIKLIDGLGGKIQSSSWLLNK
jgi:hypothetical protein